MSPQISWHDVNRIQVSANGAALPNNQGMCWWQELELFDPDEVLIGRIVLHLKRPEVALPVGDQPPYWGIDPRRRGALAMLEGEPPF